MRRTTRDTSNRSEVEAIEHGKVEGLAMIFSYVLGTIIGITTLRCVQKEQVFAHHMHLGLEVCDCCHIGGHSGTTHMYMYM